MTARETLHVFLIGEAYDDVRPVFAVDGRDYPDEQSVRADVEAGWRALHDLRLIGEVESSAVLPETPRPRLPSWPEWRARHIERGEPIGVRPRPDGSPAPAGQEELLRWLEQAKPWLDAQLAAAAAAVPGARVVRTREPAVHRIGPGSVVPAEERFRLDAGYLAVPPAGAGPDAVLLPVADWLRANGWAVAAPEESPSYVTFSATFSQYTMSVAWNRRDRALSLSGSSPEVDATTFDPQGGSGDAAHV
ncbi:hypothetical protein [Dactylosporangium matsuzakiense]|uniref:Uncharacterized protein n=1 Tax=Dactylosporangium matsuzakiense TaxID=53360 RepID=A0A9W6KTV5_9ACTN|nr:hypothetical protein [Dactylosporangium matsuzakiense]UWZ45972.1 hypothetical protein Dmats_05765 [Dactylosporangium matsuzakiense]GLL07553.1 hypothetical protein GCM10017581_093070 [Dactylosporangium matsuzakiense]